MIDSILSCLEQFSSFHSTVCIFTDFVNGFMYIFHKVLDHVHNSSFEEFVLCFSYIACLVPVVVGLLDSSGDIFCLILCFYAGI